MKQKTLYQSMVLKLITPIIVCILLIGLISSSNMYKSENSLLKSQIQHLNAELEMVKNNFENSEMVLGDSSDFERGTISVEDAEKYRQNYEKYIEANPTASGNIFYFNLDEKLTKAIKRQRWDAERDQKGVRIVFGSTNNSTLLNSLNIVQMIYPLDGDGLVMPIPEGKAVHYVSIPQANFRKHIICPPYCD